MPCLRTRNPHLSHCAFQWRRTNGAQMNACSDLRFSLLCVLCCCCCCCFFLLLCTIWSVRSLARSVGRSSYAIIYAWIADIEQLRYNTAYNLFWIFFLWIIAFVLVSRFLLDVSFESWSHVSHSFWSCNRNKSACKSSANLNLTGDVFCTFSLSLFFVSFSLNFHECGCHIAIAFSLVVFCHLVSVYYSVVGPCPNGDVSHWHCSIGHLHKFSASTRLFCMLTHTHRHNMRFE